MASKTADDNVRVKVLSSSVSWRGDEGEKTQHADQGDVIEMSKDEYERINGIDGPNMLEETDDDLLDASEGGKITVSALRAAETLTAEGQAEGSISEDSVVTEAAQAVDEGEDPEKALQRATGTSKAEEVEEGNGEKAAGRRGSTAASSSSKK